MQFDQLKPREFITLLGGNGCMAARGTRAAAGAQERMRHIGVLLPATSNDSA
jgi:hypothetical protein